MRRGVGLLAHGSYTCTTVIDENPLFSALKRKAEQLRKSKYQEGKLGIIACDAGADIFNAAKNWSTYSLDEVVREFLRKNTFVAFVMTIAITSDTGGAGAVQNSLQPKLFVRNNEEDWVVTLDRLLAKLVSSMPAINLAPINALNAQRRFQPYSDERTYQGGWQVKGNTIRISARNLLDLLSGRLDQKRFAQDHDLGGGNIFSLYQIQGKSIKSASFEPLLEQDDDWVVLEFGEGDPAVSEFKMPESHDLPL